MNENYSDPSDDILETSIASMRDRPIPDGPSDELLARTAAAMNAAAVKKPGMWWRLRDRAVMTRVAAAILIVGGAGILASLLLRSTAITCAEVIEKVRSAHAMSLVMSVNAAPAGKQRMTMVVDDQGRACISGPDGSRTVSDVGAGRVVVVQPAMKSAIVMDLKNMPADQRPDGMIEGFKNLSGKDAQDLGPAEIDGRKAEKFFATHDRQEFTVWADPQTRDPIRIDMVVSTSGQKVSVSCTDFVLNPPIPDGQFSLAVPPGYAIQQFTLNIPNPDDGLQNLIEMLRGYTARGDGKFPPNVDDMGEYIKLMIAHGTTQPTNDDMNWIVRFQMVQHFLGTLPKGEWKYLGKGKTTADKQSLIFWYKSDKGDRGIYGDLTTKDFSSPPK